VAIRKHLARLDCILDWRLGIIDAPIEDVLFGQARAVRWLLPPEGSGWADPFFDEPGKRLLFESLDDRGFGSIVEAPLAAEGGSWALGDPSTVRFPGPAIHRSFPRVQDLGDRTVLTCEMIAAEHLSLFDLSDGSPTGEEMVRPTAMADPLIIEFDGRTWIIGCHPDGPDGTVVGQFHDGRRWRDASWSSLVIGATGARPAGGAVKFFDDVVVPFQISDPWYGAAVELRKIDRLDETHFVTTPVGRLEPNDFGVDRFHTVNAVGESATVVDGAISRSAIGTGRILTRASSLLKKSVKDPASVTAWFGRGW